MLFDVQAALAEILGTEAATLATLATNRGGVTLKVRFDNWTCPTCGEPVPGDFDVCWSCGGEMG